MRVAGIVLAAGLSRRLGRPKQSVEIAGESLLQRAVRVAGEAGLSPLLAVSDADAQYVPVLSCTVVLNPEAAEGMASSIRAGVRALEASHEVQGAVLMTCDQVLMTAAHLRALCVEPERVTGSAYAGRVGVPAYFPRRSFEKLLTLRGDAGARELLCAASAITAEELALDIDTEDDLQRARALLEGAQPR